MLLLEWDRWWNSIPILTAEEQMAAYTVGVMADAGWKLDRDEFLKSWRDTIARGTIVRREPVDRSMPSGMLRQVAHKVRDWLHGSMISPGINRGYVEMFMEQQKPGTGASKDVTTASDLE